MTPTLSHATLQNQILSFFAQKKLVARITPTAIHAPSSKKEPTLIPYPLPDPSTSISFQKNFLTLSNRGDSIKIAIVPPQLKDSTSTLLNEYLSTLKESPHDQPAQQTQENPVPV